MVNTMLVNADYGLDFHILADHMGCEISQMVTFVSFQRFRFYLN